MFAKNLRYLREKKDIGQAELAKMLDKGNSTISNWEHGTNVPNVGVLSDIARIFKVSMTDLMETDLSQPNVEYVGVLQVPILANISAGKPEYTEEDIIGYTVVPANEFTNRDLFALEVKGDSMNLEFDEGMRIIVDKGATVENGQIAVVQVNGYEATVKQVRVEKDKIILIPKSTNDEHYPQIYTADDDIRIVGKVVGSFKRY